ncbi:Uncharacterized protein LW93_4925 [Fusarium fujikuroi]|nr:Uncharacterized protein LW93_4925 [Fusarium fujikuroi]
MLQGPEGKNIYPTAEASLCLPRQSLPSRLPDWRTQSGK